MVKIRNEKNNFINFFKFFFFEFSNADFKKIKKKAVVNNPEIIFPLPNDLKGCRTEMRINPKYNKS